MPRIDLTHNLLQKNDAITRAAWILCAGAKKRAEKDIILHSTDRDDTDIFARSCPVFFSSASCFRSPACHRAVKHPNKSQTINAAKILFFRLVW
jgi:hypothetical protein